MCLILLAMVKSTISMFLKNKEVIKTADVAIGFTIVHSKQRMQIMDEVEVDKIKIGWEQY